VPKLKGDTLSKAKTALRRADCGVGKITTAKSKTVAKGRVISSSPKAGSKRKAAAKVSLIVSRGKH
jgi:serine/threonine-protein kinase